MSPACFTRMQDMNCSMTLTRNRSYMISNIGVIPLNEETGGKHEKMVWVAADVSAFNGWGDAGVRG